MPSHYKMPEYQDEMVRSQLGSLYKQASKMSAPKNMTYFTDRKLKMKARKMSTSSNAPKKSVNNDL